MCAYIGKYLQLRDIKQYCMTVGNLVLILQSVGETNDAFSSFIFTFKKEKQM